MRAFIVLSLLLLGSLPAHADDFPWFRHRQYEGWIEDTGIGKARVKIVPFVMGPDTSRALPPGTGFNFGGDAAAGLPDAPPPPEITADGRLKLSYKIMRGGVLPPYAHGAVISQTGITADRLAQASKEVVRADFQSITLEIGGTPFETKPLGGHLTGDVGGAFYIPPSRDDLLRTLRTGDYRLILDYSYPLAEYSSLKVNLSSTAISSAWVEAFRQVVRTKSTSGGKFLFYDFSREVSRVHAKERVTAGGNSSLNTAINVEVRAGTPEQLARLEAVLGFARQTQADMVARHQAGFNAAMAAANPALALAHEKYLQDLNASVPDGSQQLIAALAKLKDVDALAFMAAGFQMRSGDASSFFRYDGSYAASQTSTVKSEYSEYLISSTVVQSKNLSYVDSSELVGAAIRRAYEKLHVDLFQAPSGQPLSAQQWSQGLLKAITDRNLELARYAFDPKILDVGGKIDPNLAVDGNQNRLLHHAVRTRDVELARLLLDRGASPLRKNRDGDTPLDVATDAGDAAMRGVLQGYAGKKGKVTITFQHAGLAFAGIRFWGPDLAKVTTTTTGPTSTQVVIDDYPMRVQATATVVVRFWADPNNYALIRFEHRVLGMTGPMRFVEAPVVLERSYRIRDGQTATHRETIGMVDWSRGFTVVAAESE